MAQELKVRRDEQQQRSATEGRVQRGRPQPLLTPFEEIERLFDQLMGIPALRRGTIGLPEVQGRIPNVDLIERDEELLLRAELPGVRREELDVSVDESNVTIRGTVVHEQQDELGDYYRREIAHGEYARSIPLPTAVDTEKAKASLKDGVLELRLPKLEAARRRRIEIQ